MNSKQTALLHKFLAYSLVVLRKGEALIVFLFKSVILHSFGGVFSKPILISTYNMMSFIEI